MGAAINLTEAIMRTWGALLSAACLAAVCVTTGNAQAAGVLLPQASGDVAPAISDHAVKVVINNGFARTEVRQVFHNANAHPIDAVYRFPVPPDAALSEMTIELADRTLQGEVVGKDRAQQVYDQETAAGNQAGLATQNGYQSFDFSIGNIPANSDATMSFVYYEQLDIDTGVGRFLYPLQNGGTDDGAAFWGATEQPTTGHFSFDLSLKSLVPVSEVRVPGVPAATLTKSENGEQQVHFDVTPSELTSDVVVYYKLADDQAGRADVVPYRSAAGGDGTFMLVVTPGIDLAPLEHGTDYVYVLDFSGSMQTKMTTLKGAVKQALSELLPEDRFRLVGFADQAFEIAPLQAASPANVASASATLDAAGLQGGTNLYAGLTSGTQAHDPERVTSIFLVTDGVANEGLVDAAAFDSLLRESDVRVNGFLLGNSANWPLMNVITEASGGFYAAVSNRDDILGQVLLAKGKLTHESLHEAKLSLSGVQVSDTTDFDFGKVYQGQQLVVFGRYASAGQAQLQLDTKVRNQPKAYTTSFAFPDVAEGSPELERLWALDMIHALEKRALLGLMPDAEMKERVTELGVKYQLVTNQTSMLVLDDQGFAENGVERLNQARTDTEHTAQSSGSGQGTTTPITGGSTPTASGNGTATSSSDDHDVYGGALDPLSIGLVALWLLGGRRRNGARP
jgi:Ca-activated chloride channel family protein